MTKEKILKGGDINIRKGFTVIELLAVIAVIAILVGITLGVSGIAGKKSARAQAAKDMQMIRVAFDGFRRSQGGYWAGDGDLSGSTFNFLTNHFANLNRVDPWGTGYHYDYISRFSYRLYSFGPDGEDDNQGEDDVISGDAY